MLTPARRLSAADTPLIVGAGGLIVACALSPSSIGDGPVVCPFRTLTGLPCPGCGLTRSWVYLAHGWWGHALAANPFGIVLAVAVIALVCARLWQIVTEQRGIDVLELMIRRPAIALLWIPWAAFAVARIGWYVGTGTPY